MPQAINRNSEAAFSPGKVPGPRLLLISILDVHHGSPQGLRAAWEVQTPAKLNLYLEVLGRRTDGFHELETLLVPVQIFDHLRWSPSSDPGCSLAIQSQLPASSTLDASNNLVLRAASCLPVALGIEPHGRFELTKRIPLQAGLGGGSSDAAATLRLANAAWETRLSDGELTGLAAELGSDVPFFMNQAPLCAGDVASMSNQFPTCPG